MNENIVERNRKLAQTVIKGLAARGMEGFYAETKEDALKQALAMIPEGAKVGWGGSFSVDEIGLRQAVMAGNYEWRDRDGAANPEEKREAEIFGYCSDFLKRRHRGRHSGQYRRQRQPRFRDRFRTAACADDRRHEQDRQGCGRGSQPRKKRRGTREYAAFSDSDAM